MKIRSNRKHNSLIMLAWIMGFLIIFLILCDIRIRPVLLKVAVNEGKLYATENINNSILEALQKNHNRYDELVHISYNNEGNIASVETDTIEMNRIHVFISDGVNKSYKDIGNQVLAVRLGTVTGFSYLAGSGPLIKFKVMPVGNIETRVVSEFKSAGINQTLHQIRIEIVANGAVVIPGDSTEFKIERQYILSDTIIVGSIPESYTYITGDKRDDISKINDYGSNSGGYNGAGQTLEN